MKSTPFYAFALAALAFGSARLLSEEVISGSTVPASTVEIECVLIPAGRFQMREGDQFEDVQISKPFLFGKTEVTQGQWKKVMGTEPWKQSKRYFKEGANYPATFVS